MENKIIEKNKIFTYLKVIFLIILLSLSAWFIFSFLIKINDDTNALDQNQTKISLIYWILAVIIYISFLVYYVYKFIKLWKYTKHLSDTERIEWKKQNINSKSILLLITNFIPLLIVTALSWWYVSKTLSIIENNDLSFKISNILSYIVIFTSPIVASLIIFPFIYLVSMYWTDKKDDN